MNKAIIAVGAIAVVLAGTVFGARMASRDAINPTVNLKVTSESFSDGGVIPVLHTGRGEDASPQLGFGPLDPKAKSLAVVMDDTDHPLGNYNHWVMWNVPATVAEIPQGVPKGETVPSLGGAVQGRSAYGGKHYYRGPLPPFGTHEYVFKVYVLDCFLKLGKDSKKADLQRAMQGHVLQYGTLTGRYGKNPK